MAEKKFFVDINLQGNKLVNGTVGANSSMTKAGSFGFNESNSRLEYFNGSTLQEIANLSDISAVTGGLILQGGYDADTNTPNITDGTALKGFFWVVTVAGSFLGESVQIGDSIIAKIDEAGATLSDWLILQGNVVIATDTVDGISRLATQTEANDGTEGGAVVITPATLQGKIDSQITPAINDKLSKQGGTMSGGIDMNVNNITNINFASATNLAIDNLDGLNGPIKIQVGLDAQGFNPYHNIGLPTDGGDAANKTYVDDQDALKLSLTGGTMSGAIDMGNNDLNNVQYVNATGVATDQLISTTTPNIALGSNLDADNAQTIINLPAPTNGGDATNKTYVDGQVATSLPLAGGTMEGNINLNSTYDIVNANDISPKSLSACASTVNIEVRADLNLGYGNGQKIINLVQPPTDNYDATNKAYVDGVGATAESNANAYTDTAINNNSGMIILPSDGWLDSGSGDYYQILNVSAYTVGSYPPITQIVNQIGEVIELSTSMENIGLLRVACNVPGNGFNWTVLVTKAL